MALLTLFDKRKMFQCDDKIMMVVLSDTCFPSPLGWEQNLIRSSPSNYNILDVECSQLFWPPLPTSSTLWAVDEWTITGQLHWALGSRGFESSPGRMADAHRQCLQWEQAAAWKEAPFHEQREGKQRFNLAMVDPQGGPRCNMHTCSNVLCDRQLSRGAGRSLSSKHPAGRWT